jgi:hypothetical protein
MAVGRVFSSAWVDKLVSLVPSLHQIFLSFLSECFFLSFMRCIFFFSDYVCMLSSLLNILFIFVHDHIFSHLYYIQSQSCLRHDHNSYSTVHVFFSNFVGMHRKIQLCWGHSEWLKSLGQSSLLNILFIFVHGHAGVG